MKQIIMIGLMITTGVVISCNSKDNSKNLSGLWKIHKIELMKDDELKKVLDTDCQYWQFENKTAIEIFDKQQVQNILHIKMGRGKFSSYDSSGSITDEYVIRKMDKSKMELTCSKRLDAADYCIYYYLDKVEDSLADDIKLTN